MTTSPVPGILAAPASLGAIHYGICAADPSAAIEPETLSRYCNFGRARGHCKRASQSEADAVRFLVQGENGGLVRIAWATDRNHHPVATGTAEVSTDQTEPESGPLTAQLRACATVYLLNR